MKTYLVRVLLILPLVAVVTLVPPYPWETKLFSLAAFFVVLLIPQLVEMLIVAQNARRQAESDVMRDTELHGQVEASERPMSRKERRIRT
ncbi:hypothetical protein ACFVWL_00755 [Microbacterium sp. NPDC058269]|uniref:hypothetical protein n=1 Tax=Microbacterium sp. NPDC058269 TaxID=3346414 RepID=UPI0036DCFA9C